MVHRWSGGPEDDWRPWLKAELEQHGYEIHVPSMPDTEVPVIEKWVNHLAQVVGTPDEHTYFIGHSIGCQTILRYLETLSSPIGGAVFVAGWFRLENLEDDEVRAIARPWMETPIDAERIRRVLPKSTLIISENDPFGAFDENVAKFTALNTAVITLPDAGHITAKDGFLEFPTLRDVFLSTSN